LVWNIEARKNVAIAIIDVGKREIVFNYEILHRSRIAVPCDTSYLHFALPSFVCSLDRG
jgi:hypothetical protein